MSKLLWSFNLSSWFLILHWHEVRHGRDLRDGSNKVHWAGGWRNTPPSSHKSAGGSLTASAWVRRSRSTHDDCSLDVTPYWRQHTLNLPGNWLLMTSFGQSCTVVVVKLLSSSRVLSFFPRQQISCSFMVGISAPWILKIFFVIFPFSMQRLLDF